MVPCEIYPVVWQAWEGVFGCVCIKEAKTGTISRKRYVVDVLFCFSAHLLLSGLVISVCVGIWRPWFTYLLLWLKINTAFILNLTKVFCFHGFLGIAEYTFQLQDRLSALIPPCSGTHKLLYKKKVILLFCLWLFCFILSNWPTRNEKGDSGCYFVNWLYLFPHKIVFWFTKDQMILEWGISRFQKCWDKYWMDCI